MSYNLTNYYDKVSSLQDTWLIYPIQRLVDTIASYVKVSNPIIEFNPLREATEREAAETRKLNTESDKMDIETGVYTPEEVRVNRGVDG